MGRVAGKKLFSIMALCAMVGLLLLPIAVSLPSLAMGADAPDAVKKDGEAKVEKGRDVYYKTEGIAIGAPAPKTVDGPRDYPRYNFESRVLLWFANQQHLYYGSFVLAVPIFCMVIEFMGVVTKDKAMAGQRRVRRAAAVHRLSQHAVARSGPRRSDRSTPPGA